MEKRIYNNNCSLANISDTELHYLRSAVRTLTVAAKHIDTNAYRICKELLDELNSSGRDMRRKRKVS